MFLVHNERTKLTANWLNALAAALVAAGFFGPIAALVYRLAPVTIDIGYMIAVALGCLVLGAFLHLLGRVSLQGLRE